MDKYRRNLSLENPDAMWGLLFVADAFEITVQCSVYCINRANLPFLVMIAFVVASDQLE